MTTVRTPRAAARTAAVAGAGRGLAAADDLADKLTVLTGSLRQTEVVDVSETPPGDRLLRLQRRRRLAREQVLAVLFLFVALAITVGVLAMQWLGSGGPASGSAAPSPVSISLSGGPA